MPRCWPVTCPAPSPISISRPMSAPARRADGQAVSSLISCREAVLFIAHTLQEQAVYETEIWHWLVKTSPKPFLWWHQGKTYKLCFMASLWENNWDRNTEFFGVRQILENYVVFLPLILCIFKMEKMIISHDVAGGTVGIIIVKCW